MWRISYLTANIVNFYLLAGTNMRKQYVIYKYIANYFYGKSECKYK